MEISSIVSTLAIKLGIEKTDLPTYGSSRDFGYPHIEVDENGYHFVVIERGREIERQTTRDLDELLYIIFEFSTSEIARQHELSNRKKNADPRRIFFAKQEELLTKLNPEWGARRQIEHKKILIKHPFDDYASERVLLFKKFSKKGMSNEEAWKLACKTYPVLKKSE